jgi:transketolase
MRQVIDQFIASSEDHNSILITADMGRFPLAKAAGKLIDVGLSESLLVNIASGLSLAGENVFIYGVAGFVLHRALEQLKMNFDQRTSCGGRPMRLHFLNAGAGFLYN